MLGKGTLHPVFEEFLLHFQPQKVNFQYLKKLCYCLNKDNIERGTLVDKIPIGGKYIVEYVYNDCVTSDGLVFYFDEIKPVMRVKGDLQ